MTSEYKIQLSTVLLALVVLAAAVAVGSGTVVGQTANEVDIQDSGSEIVESGSTDLVISGVDSNEGVGAFEVNVSYNENIDSIQVSDSNRFTVESETRETNGNTTVTILGYRGETDPPGTQTVTLAEIQATSQNYGSTGGIQVDEVSTLINPEGDDIAPINVGTGASFTISQSSSGSDDDDSSGGGGGSPGGDDGAGDGDEGPTTVQQVRDQLNLVEPSTTTQTEISDNDPDTPGTQITPEGTESVRQISFTEEDISGNVDINEYSNPPQEIRSSVSDSVSAAGAVERGDVSVVSISDITPDNEAAEDSGATVEFAVPTNDVNSPEQLTVVKETYDFDQQETTWSELDTTLENVGDEEITLSAQAESFSLFAVVEVESTGSPADDGGQQQEDDGQQPDDSDGLPTSAIIIGLLVVVAIAGAIIYARNNN